MVNDTDALISQFSPKVNSGNTPQDPDELINSFKPGSPTDIQRIKSSFSDPAHAIPSDPFLSHPINWLESHAGNALPMAGMTLGSMGGGTIGGPVGAVGGAAAGGGAGEAARDYIGRMLGVNTAPVAQQAGKEALTSAAADLVGAPIMKGIGYVGKTLYNSPIRPVIENALREGKSGVEDVLYKYGVKTPWNLPQKAQDIVNNILNNQVNPVLKRAEQGGATIDIDSAMKPLEDFRNEELAIRTPESQNAAAKAQEKIDFYRKNAAQKPYGPAEATKVKSRIGYDVPTGQSTPLDQRITNKTYSGFMGAAEDALSPADKALVHQGNADAGKLIATESGQNTAANQYGRHVGNLTSLTGTDAFAAGAGGAFGHGDPRSFLYGLLAKKVMDTARVSQMPVGYALKRAANSVAGKRAVNASVQGILDSLHGGDEGQNK